MKLRAGDLVVVVDGEDGARLTSLRHRDDELLVTDGERPWNTDSFVMAPYAGRVRDGVARWDGQVRHLPALDPPHALHGFVHDRPWTPVPAPGHVPDAGPDDAVATWRTEVSADEWFARLVLHQRLRVTPDALHLELTADAPDAPAPVTLGWHPWFPRELDGVPLTLRLPAASCLARDERGIATTTRVPVPAGPLDDCLVDLAGPVEVHWADRLAVTVTSDAAATVIYTGHPRGVCVEPQSGPPNEVNTTPRVVLPGQPLRLRATLAVRRPSG